MRRPLSWQGKSVKTSAAVKSTLSEEREAIPAGLAGKVVWDEGGDEVVVEFEQEVSNRGFDTDNKKQSWVPRDCLSCL